jgi:hypothetical protein
MGGCGWLGMSLLGWQNGCTALGWIAGSIGERVLSIRHILGRCAKSFMPAPAFSFSFRQTLCEREGLSATFGRTSLKRRTGQDWAMDEAQKKALPPKKQGLFHSVSRADQACS